jgi:hypothetical protein
MDLLLMKALTETDISLISTTLINRAFANIQAVNAKLRKLYTDLILTLPGWDCIIGSLRAANHNPSSFTLSLNDFKMLMSILDDADSEIVKCGAKILTHLAVHGGLPLLL